MFALLKRFFLSKSVINNIISNYSTSVSAILLSLVFTPVYIWYLGIESFGIIGFINSLLIFINFLDLGMGSSINREMAKHYKDPAKSVYIHQLNFSLQIIYIVVGIIASLLLISASSFLATSWFNAKNTDIATLKYAFIILSITIACRWPYSYYSSALRGMQYQVLLNAHEIFWNIIKAFGSWILVKYFSASITTFLWYQCLIIGLQTLGSAFLVWFLMPKVKVKNSFNWAVVKSIGRFAGATGASAILVAFIFESDKLILSKILTGPEFGYYMFSVGIAVMVYNISMPIGMAVFPHFTAAFHNKDTDLIERDFHKYTRILATLLLPFSLTLAFFAKEILMLWTKNPDIVKSASALVRVMLTGTVLHSFMAVPHVLVMARGKVRLILYSNLVALGLIVPITIFLSTHYGAFGGAVGYSVIFGGYFLVQAPVLIKLCLPGNVKKWFWNDIIRIAIPLFVIIIPIWLFTPKQFYSGLPGMFFIPSVGLILLVVAYKMSGLNMAQNFLAGLKMKVKN
jgi:O-antigen/teichoic acid export membrane protein